MARDWNEVAISPAASIPAVKYWLDDTPGAMSSLNTEPEMSSSAIGKTKMNTTASRSRLNCSSSTCPREPPMRSSRDRLVAACSAVAVIGGSDQLQVDVLERRPAHGQARHLA